MFSRAPSTALSRSAGANRVIDIKCLRPVWQIFCRSRLWILVLVATCVSSPLMAAESVRPNVVVILVDDLGYGDIGCDGSRVIQTSQLDRLAPRGRAGIVRSTANRTIFWVAGRYPVPVRGNSPGLICQSAMPKCAAIWCRNTARSATISSTSWRSTGSRPET